MIRKPKPAAELRQAGELFNTSRPESAEVATIAFQAILAAPNPAEALLRVLELGADAGIHTHILAHAACQARHAYPGGGRPLRYTSELIDARRLLALGWSKQAAVAKAAAVRGPRRSNAYRNCRRQLLAALER